MDAVKEYMRVAAWVAKEISGTISGDEREKLQSWLRAEEGNRCIYESIRKRLAGEEKMRSYDRSEVVRADWMKVKSQLKPRKKFVYVSYWKYAAVVAFVIASVLFWARWQDEKSPRLAMNPVTGIHAGKKQATLFLDNGEKIELSDSVVAGIYQEGVVITQKSEQLVYEDTVKGREEKERFHVLSVPRGGEYNLQLTDGTVVYLNSGTEFKFPVKFTGDTRTVFVKGEAYFEVAPDREKPFIVQTIGDLSVKVLGTAFNVCAYENKEDVQTTLVHGGVLLSGGNRRVTLKPDQQAVFNKTSGQFEVKEVDASIYVSWKDGNFFFENETLENIMDRLCLWYNINVFYRNDEVRGLRFSGDLEKYEDFSEVLRMLEKVQRIEIEINGNNVIISAL